MHRIGIIPFDIKDDAMALLFVTSQTRGRWVLPKGKAKKNETHIETCHREGFEEAGVRGVVLEDFPITLAITKKSDNGMMRIPVTYYPMFVQEQVNKWPEQNKRLRHWALIEDVPKVAYRDDLVHLVRQFEDLRKWIKKAAVPHKSQQQEQLTPAQ